MAQKKKENNEVHSFSVGRIKVKILENHAHDNNSKWLNTKIFRPYTHDGEEKESTQFNCNDLLFVAKAAHMAFDWIKRQDSTEPDVDSIEDSEE